MNAQFRPDSGDPYPLLTVDEKELKREIALHSSSSELHTQTLIEGVLSPTASIVSEEEEIVIAVRHVRDYNHALTCCHNQLGFGMTNCGPR